MALEYDLEIIPVINKIDLPAAQPERVAAEIEKLIGVSQDKIIAVSAKTGENVDKVLDMLVDTVPDPTFSIDKFNFQEDIPRALIFDSVYDPYRGVVIYVKSVNAKFKNGERVYLIHSQKELLIQEA